MKLSQRKYNNIKLSITTHFLVREFSIKKIAKMNSIDTKFMCMAIPAIWERNERRVRQGKSARIFQINGVLHVDGNIMMSDLEKVMPDAILSKLKLIYSGDQPLRHEKESDLVQSMLLNAKQLYKVKQDILAKMFQTYRVEIEQNETFKLS